MFCPASSVIVKLPRVRVRDAARDCAPCRMQVLSEEGLRKLGPSVAHMASVEGLEAHRRAVTLRLDALKAA